MSQTSNADQILAQIVESGHVSSEQVAALQKCVDADWIVDKSEAESLFKANRAIAENDEDCPEWGDFYIASVTKLVVRDMETPGEIDQEEGDWLGGLFEQFGVGNSSEHRLIADIKESTSKVAGKATEFLG